VKGQDVPGRRKVHPEGDHRGHPEEGKVPGSESEY
jgi:hypothetical protein